MKNKMSNQGLTGKELQTITNLIKEANHTQLRYIITRIKHIINPKERR